MLNDYRQFGTKPHLWLITFIGVIVPQRLRADWRQEWEAELRYRERLMAEWDKLHWRTKLDLLRRSVGALWDALCLQPHRLEDEMFQDLRYGARMLRTHKGFTIVAALTLALGIGANTAIFSVVYAVLLRPLPFKEPEQLVTVWERDPKQGYEGNMTTPATFLDWREQNEVFAEMATFASNRGFALTGDAEAERITGAVVSANLFSLLGVAPLLGRDFLPEEETSGRNQVALLSHSLWQRRFGADPQIIGKTVTLDAKPFTVVGVMPRGFEFPGMTGVLFGFFANQPAELWVPADLGGEARTQRRSHIWQTLARLKPGATVAQATARMNLLQQRVLSQNPNYFMGTHVKLDLLREQGVANVRLGLLILLGAVGCVLLIACANVANLLLARAAAREKEVAVRLALGAGRLRLLRQFLTESVLLAFLGAGLGLLTAHWGLVLLQRTVAANIAASTPGWNEIGISLPVLAFTLAVALLTGCTFGLAPAWRAIKTDLHTSLKESGRGTSSHSRQRLQHSLITAQIALSLMLLLAAGLLIRSFARLQQVDPGFQPARLLTVKLDLPNLRYPQNEQKAAFFDRLLERFKSLPGVQSAGMTLLAPFGSGGSNGGIRVEGRTEDASGKSMNADWRAVTPEYFATMGIPLVKGRGFTAQDTKDAQPVVLINEAFAHAYLPGVDPLGKRVAFLEDKDRVVVGVVRDFKQTKLDADVRVEMYTPQAQLPAGSSRTFVLRTFGDPLTLAHAVRHEVQTLDRDLPITQLQPMETIIAGSVASQRFRTLLLALFAALALILAVIGIYGVITYAVTQRAHELGIRLALGAQRRDILSLVLRQGMKLTGAGILMGLVGAFALTRWLRSLLFGISPTDLLTFAVTPLLFVVVALLACYLPARRATKVDPLTALRHE